MIKPDKFTTLVKFSSTENIIDLQRHGKLYMNTVGYFRECENTSQLDRLEGMDFLHQADKIVSIQVDNNRGNKILLSKNTGLINFMGGRLSNFYTNIFCMYLLTVHKDCKANVDSRMFSFGDTALVITKPDEFISRIVGVIKNKGYKYGIKPVSYFDEEIYHGNIGLFRKRKSLSFMNEFRIAMAAMLDNKPYELFIGDISDISVIIRSQDINKIQFIVVQENKSPIIC